jgi:hypothetical protein
MHRLIQFNRLLGDLIRFQEPRRHYGEIAKDALLGGGVSAAGTAGLLAASGLGLRRKAPALAKMLTTAAGQHIKVFNPMHTIPMMRSLPEASRLFGKQLSGVKEVEHLATSGAMPSAEHIASSFRKTGINPEKDIADIAAFKKRWGRTPGESMEKSVGLLSGMAATGVGGAGGAALSKGWEKRREEQLSARLDDLIEFARGQYAGPAMEAIRKAEGMSWPERKLTAAAVNPFYEQKAPKEGGALWQAIRNRAAVKIRRMRRGNRGLHFSSARNLFNKVKEIQFKTLYQPGEKDEPPEELPDFSEGQPVDYTVQQHHAKRAGFHRDIRIGTPKHGLYSWATRKELPEAGGKIAIHPQPIHPHDYLGWEGDIPSGYGAGKVSTEHLGKALITKSTPTEVHATLADQKEHHRLAFVKTPKGWLLARGKHPEPPREAQKPKYKSVSQEKAPEHLSSIEPGTIVQPKVDGALVYVTTEGNRPEVFSHRKSKVSNKNILHTERVFHGRPTTNIPKEHQRTLLGELYGTRGGKAIEPQELGGILNTHLGESIAKQKARGVKLKIMPFDYANGKGETYPERLEKVKSTLQYMPKDVFQMPPEAKTPSAARALYEKVRSGRHPLTKEGVIIHPPKGKMIKIKNVEEENVKIHSVFPGKGKFEDGYGGFYYADKFGRPLGRVGTGFTEETRAELPKYIGRTARVRHQGKYKSGRLRAPSLIAIEENK